MDILQCIFYKISILCKFMSELTFTLPQYQLIFLLDKMVKLLIFGENYCCTINFSYLFTFYSKLVFIALLKSKLVCCLLSITQNKITNVNGYAYFFYLPPQIIHQIITFIYLYFSSSFIQSNINLCLLEIFDITTVNQNLSKLSTLWKKKACRASFLANI